MSKAVKCPVCNGKGTKDGMDENVGGTTPFCHGCSGKGWVTVLRELSEPYAGYSTIYPREQKQL